MAVTVPNEIAAPPENLALFFQELFTAIVRLRSHRQEVSDAQVFRGQVLQAIRAAQQNAKARGYTDEDIQAAIFAVVAFLDETILNLRQPVFNEWVRKPLQEELFGRHVAGEVFFQNLEHLLGRRDSPELADLLEVYALCVLLGYLGRYSIASKGDLRALMGHTEDKIQRIRGSRTDLSPYWMLPDDVAPVRADPWMRRLAFLAAACAFLAFALFASYKIALSSGVSSVQILSLRGGR
ncbi:MAG TPA: DotU family type IV/VI secretion system protein [Bryobacteraceae bacterium]|nr:DotU family type IV/VI secretion system protein [Bryobacteraceae bacterium]